MKGYIRFAVIIASIVHASVYAFQPLLTHQRFASLSAKNVHRNTSSDNHTTDGAALDASIQSAKDILYRAAETRSEGSDAVVGALLDLEKLMRQKNKQNPEEMESTLRALSGDGGGSWRLIFTTGTINTQERSGRINYFPIKATQSFQSGESTPWKIENGLYAGGFPLVKFKGAFTWMASPKSGVTKLEFDFTNLELLNFFDLKLKAGEAANLGAKSGLGSEANAELERKGKRPFFNWISADERIATARGGGGGLALWKRVDYEGGGH